MRIEHTRFRPKLPPILAFAGTLALGLVLTRLLGQFELPWITGKTPRTVAMVALVLGAGIALSAAAQLNRKPGQLIRDGVYRWSRHPAYFGLALAYFGAALRLDSIAALLLLPPLLFILQREVIAPEEADLRARFGPAYRAYAAEVRRWI